MNKNYKIITEAGYYIEYGYDFSRYYLTAMTWEGFVETDITTDDDRDIWYLDTIIQVESHRLRYRGNDQLQDKLRDAKSGSKLDIILTKIIKMSPQLRALKETLDILAALPATPLPNAHRKSSKRL